MPVTQIQKLRGMVTEPLRRKVGACSLAKNVTFWRGAPECRRGTQQVYNGVTLTADGPVVGLHRYRSRLGSDYRIVAAYNTTQVSSANYGLRVCVMSGIHLVASATFQVNSTTPVIAAAPVAMTAFGDSVYITGEALGRLIRVRFQRHEVSVAEAQLVDRTLDEFSAADDPGPWLARLPNARCIEAFQGRVFVAGMLDDPDTLFWSNVGDALGWSAQNFIRIREGGRITALVEAGAYLLVFKETRVYAVRGGFTSGNDTSVEVVEPRIGSLGQRCTVKLPGGAVICMSAEGIAQINPQGGSTILSADIANWLRGRLHMTNAAQFDALVPNPESLKNCPMAFLPTRRELYVALSAQASPADIGGKRWGVTANMWLVGTIGDDGIDWSIWQGGTVTYPVFATCSILAGVDSDGNDEVLFGQHNGRVHAALKGSTDIYATAVNTTTTAAVTGTLVPNLVPDDLAERSAVTRVELVWEDSNMASPPITFTYGIGYSDGSQSDTVGTQSLYSRNFHASLQSGIASGTALRSMGVQSKACGIRAVSTGQPWYVKISGAPLPMMLGAKVETYTPMSGIE